MLFIDDGSTDGTGEIALRHGADLLRAPNNVGKTQALRFGLQTVQTSHVVLIDADLLGLTDKVVDALIAPVADGSVYASVSLRGNAPWIWRRIGLDYISGERVLPVEVLEFGWRSQARFLESLGATVTPWPGEDGLFRTDQGIRLLLLRRVRCERGDPAAALLQVDAQHASTANGQHIGIAARLLTWLSPSARARPCRHGRG